MNREIITLAQTLSGAGEDQKGLLELLCTAARQRWEARLRPGVAPEDCAPALCCAAALTAAADLSAGGGGGSVASFTAGAVSVQCRTAAESAGLARELRQTACRLMAPYALAEDFCFQEV